MISSEQKLFGETQSTCKISLIRILVCPLPALLSLSFSFVFFSHLLSFSYSAADIGLSQPLLQSTTSQNMTLVNSSRVPLQWAKEQPSMWPIQSVCPSSGLPSKMAFSCNLPFLHKAGLIPAHVPNVAFPTRGLLHRPFALLTVGGLRYAWRSHSSGTERMEKYLLILFMLLKFVSLLSYLFYCFIILLFYLFDTPVICL